MSRRLFLISLALGLGLSNSATPLSWAQPAPPSLAPPPGGQPPRKPLPPGAAPPGAVPKGVAPGEKKEQERVRIYADHAIYKRKEKRAQAIGHVKIIQDNTTIYADDVLYNEETKQSFVDKGVKIVQVNKKEDKGRTTVITAVKMTAYHEEKRMFLQEDVRMDREPYHYELPKDYTDDKKEKRKRTENAIKKDRSVVTADQMEYFTRSENANLLGNVVFLQKDKKMTGDKAFIRGEQDGDTVTMENNAVVTQINGNWLIKNKIIKPDPEDEEQQRFVKEKLVIAADKITLFRATDDLKAEGHVKITQKVGGKERVAVGNQATFSDREQLATLTGDVKIQRENGDWLTADKALFYTEKEAFEAIGTSDAQVVSEFTIDEDDKRTSKEPINKELPPFDLDKHEPGPRLPSWLKQGPQPRRAPSQPTESAPPGKPPAASSANPRPQASPAPSPMPQKTAGPQRKPRQHKARPTQTAAPQPTPVESSFVIHTGN